jgi:hypothetical protein
MRVQAGVEQSVSVTLNGTTITRTPLDGRPVTLAASVTGPLHQAAPNVIAFEHRYYRSPVARGPAHRLGTSGPTVPVDAVVRSAAQPYGDTASIRLGFGELALNRRGYNLVALDASGAVQDRVSFDTFGDPTASGRLAAWVRALPAGTIVLGAVKDEASAQLHAEAVGALATLGVRGDLRGRYRESHAFIGLKGAPAASAVEALGPRAIEIRVGEPDATFGLELLEFSLGPGAQ